MFKPIKEVEFENLKESIQQFQNMIDNKIQKLEQKSEALDKIEQKIIMKKMDYVQLNFIAKNE